MKRKLLGAIGSLLIGSHAWAQTPAPVPAAIESPSPLSGTFEESASSSNRIWGSAEYLLWWFRNGPAPIPVATSVPRDSTAPTPGALGNADTTVLLGGRPIDSGAHHGARITFGSWLDEDQQVGAEASYFFLADRHTSQTVGGGAEATAPLIGNPFFDASTNKEGFNQLAGSIAGSATLASVSRMQGVECNVLLAMGDNSVARVSLLTGFRFLQLQEGISVSTEQTDPNATGFVGQFVNTVDSFSTRNNFFAGQLGARVEKTFGRFFIEATGKVALGDMHELVDIEGFTETNTGPNRAFTVQIPVTTVPGGIYAEPTNIGRFSRDRFAVAPELAIQTGVNFGQHVRAFVGYNLLYVSDVVRPGNQMDGTINSTQLASFTGVPSGPLVGAARPAPNVRDSDFLAQGINFGVAIKY